jgi:hypothetical protein
MCRNRLRIESSRRWVHKWVHGWRGAIGLYQSMLREGAELAALAKTPGLHIPVLAIGAGGGRFTLETMAKVSATEVKSVLLEGVGHYAAMGAPDRLATAIVEFVASAEGV